MILGFLKQLLAVLWEALWKLTVYIPFVIGVIWILARLPSLPLVLSEPDPYQNIILDESRLVRCRTIDRSQPACTLLSDCEDRVDRCVVTFEILRRPGRLSDFLPEELPAKPD
jgi:hypothetical protein